jgi:molecular chaperone DnaJ
MEDPYLTLGIRPGASDEELTQAYRRLAKKYHPDINPGNKAAELKMREVNAAYEQIKKQKAGGADYEQAQSQGFNFWSGDFGDFFGGEQVPEINQARVLVESRRYQEALFVLSKLPDRSGEWYFYSALANAGLGNRVTALSHAGEAARLEPGNGQYRQLLFQLQSGSSAYRRAGEGRGFNMQSFGNTIFRIMMAQLFCYCCCRPC